MRDEQARGRKKSDVAKHSATGPSQSLLPSDQAHPDQGYAADGANAPTGHTYTRHGATQNFLMVIFTGLILVVTSVYSYFSYGQWTSMDKSLDETRKNRELEYRAYVAVRSVTLTPDATRPGYGKLTVSYINTGRTPGTNGQVVSSVEVRENTIPEDSGFSPADHPPGKTILAPSIEVESGIGVILLEPSKPTTDGGPVPSNGVRGKQPSPVPSPTPPPQSTRNFYAWGIISYDDIFGRPHRTKFCFKNAPGTEKWGFCETYNSVD